MLRLATLPGFWLSGYKLVLPTASSAATSKSRPARLVFPSQAPDFDEILQRLELSSYTGNVVNTCGKDCRAPSAVDVFLSGPSRYETFGEALVKEDEYVKL